MADIIQDLITILKSTKQTILDNLKGYLTSGDTSHSQEEKHIEVGKEYFYNSKNGKKLVKVISIDSSVKPGPDKLLGTADDIKGEDLGDGQAFVVFSDANGKYTNTIGSSVPIKNLSE